MSNLKLDWNLFRLQLSAWCCSLLFKCIDFIRVILILFAPREVRKGELCFCLRAVFCGLWVPPSSFLRSGRTFLVRCWRGRLFLHPKSGVWVNPDGAAPVTRGRDAHRFHPIAVANLSSYLRERKPTKPWRPDQTSAGRGNSSLASADAR